MAEVDQIDALLPQIHCEKCGYKGCKPYAQALANGEAEINLCHPGGEVTMQALAGLLNKPEQALAPEAIDMQTPQTAVIEADQCIGCTKCIKVCPVDAIIGAAKKLHVVISDHCTGCTLCVPACPVDCIEIIPLDTKSPSWVIGAEPSRAELAEQSRARFEKRNNRLAKEQSKAKQQRQAVVQNSNYQSEIEAAIARARNKRKPIDFSSLATPCAK